jgi:hypothetical protein
MHNIRTLRCPRTSGSQTVLYRTDVSVHDTILFNGTLREYTVLVMPQDLHLSYVSVKDHEI